MRTGFISGAVCPEALMQRIVKEFNMEQFTTGYGMTECSPIMYICDAADPFLKKSQTVGRVGPMTQSQLVNPKTGKIVPWGEKGEVCIKGYLVMKGYWDDAEKTKEAIDSEGWMHTGDLGYYDDEGFLRIIGRSKDMIIRGGENVSPKEVEEYLMKHPNISDA